MPKWTEPKEIEVTSIKKGDILLMDGTEWEVLTIQGNGADGRYYYTKWVAGAPAWNGRKTEEFFFYNYRCKKVKQMMRDCEPCFDSDCDCIWEQYNAS